ncbi:DUF6263 family protein [uncultured Psychroserpens sp.]|uniref:DUF6263 family protein n=1 Tax=uncultured Psychroserpens sp. TaxID=255436 RepID=UPI002621E7A8|nr:DUF6263 family protein [uncultured Psychroserpens sp.]
MKLDILKFFIAFLVIINFSTAQTQLAYNLKVGDQFKVQQIANQDIVQEMNEQKHEMTNLIEGDFTFIVDGVNDSLYTIKFRFDRFKMLSKSNLAGELMSINTNDVVADDDIEGKIFAQLVETDLSMKMYKNGKIKSIKGSEALIDKMVNAVGDLDDFTKEIMREAMRGEFSNESLAKSFEQMTYIYPSSETKIGDSWTNTFEGDLSANNTWTLDDIKNDDIMISGNSSITFKNKDEEVEMDLAGDMTSQITTSMETGFVKSMSSKSVASGHSTMHKMNGIKLPTSITTNITYKIEKHVQ